MPDFSSINVFEFNELLMGIKQDSKRAFELLYIKYAERIYYAAYAYVGKLGLAEDVVNEIMLKIIKLSKKSKYINNPGAWLFAITKNYCLNLLKKNKKLILCSDIYIQDNFDIAESESMFKDHLECLDEKEKLVIVLKISFGYTIKEIANELKMSESSIEKIFFKVKEKLIEKF